MSPRASPSPSSHSSSPMTRASTSSACIASQTNMQGTEYMHESVTTGRAVCNYHTRQTGEANEDPWAMVISREISLVNEPLQTFFKDYVPCHRTTEDPSSWSNPAEVFEAAPSSVQETDKYPHLIKGLRKLVSDSNSVRRPKFADGSKCAVPFPFKDWEEDHHYTLPAILMSFPGEYAHNDTWAQTWHGIAMVFEVKNAADPINESAPWPSVRQGATATGVLTQLAKSARNLMLTHGMLFVFVVGIHKDSARIYRFDRAGCVVSRSFNIKTTPWPLHELLWRVCHYRAPAGDLPTEPLIPRLLGEDPTLFPASDQDKDMADEKCKETGQRSLSEDERQACRWVAIAKYDSDENCIGSTRILLYRVRSLNPQLFSRATVVWEGYEDRTWKRLAVKDAWRQVARDREDAFYDQIRESMQDRSWRDVLDDYKFMHGRTDGGKLRLPPFPFGPYQLSAEGSYDFPPELEELLVEAQLDPMVGELFGLARMKYGDDLGAREAAKLARFEDGSCPWPARYEVYHRTICLGSRDAAGGNIDTECYERSHMRLVFETVGRPLSQFMSTKELIKGFRDAIYGHRQAYRAGIIHRDISENNVMLSDDSMSSFVGFLLDLDYGFNWVELLQLEGWEVSEESWRRYVEEYDSNLPQGGRPAPPEKEISPMGDMKQDGITEQSKAERENVVRMKMKERIGTFYFMAIDILEADATHDVRHDLESFFWLLLWVVLRYTATTCFPPNEPYETVFGAHTDNLSACVKYNFLRREMYWEVKGNKPLTTLIRKYKQLCYFSLRRPLEPGGEIPLTHDAILDLFNEALADPGWPHDDHALQFEMHTTTVTSASQDGSRATDSRGGEKRRELPGDEDPLTQPAHMRAHIYRRPAQNLNVVGGVYQTVNDASGGGNPNTDSQYNERSPVPLVCETVGRPLSKSRSTRGWPQNDPALPCKMPSASQASDRADIGPHRGEKRREAPGQDPLMLPAHKRAHI